MILKQLLKIFLSLIIAIAIYSLILTLDLPLFLITPIRNGASWLVLCWGILLYFCYSLRGWLGVTLSLTFTLVLFGLPLVRLWETGVSESVIVGGLFPWSDPIMYYWHSGNLLQGLTMVRTVNSARPIFVGILSFFLYITQENLQITLAILTALIAVSCYFLARELQKTYSPIVGVLVILILFIFITPLIGSLMTEIFGLSLGVLSFALLLRSARQMSFNLALLAIFIITIALNTRTGTFFVLPSLILWGGYVFRGSKLLSYRFLILGFTMVLMGFILNSALLKIIGHPETASSYGNFGFMFYGVITDTDWTQITADYPELEKLKGINLSSRVNEIVWQRIRENPLDSLKGIIKQWYYFFLDRYNSIFFIERNYLELWLRFFASIGFVYNLFRVFKNPTLSLLIFYVAGVVASIPFVPIQDGGLRVYAATIVIFPVISMVGLLLTSHFILSLIKPKNSEDKLLLFYQKNSVILSPLLPLFTVILISISFIAPVTIKYLSKPVNIDNFSCPIGSEKALFRYNFGSFINLVDDNAVTSSRLPNIKIGDFRGGLKTFAPWLEREREAFARLESGKTIVDVYGWMWLVTDTNLLPDKKGFMVACGNTENVDSLRFFHGDYVKMISK